MRQLGRDALRFGIASVVLGISCAILPPAWLEESSGFAPDGGSGGFEAGLAAVLIVIGLRTLWSIAAVRARWKPNSQRLPRERGLQ